MPYLQKILFLGIFILVFIGGIGFVAMMYKNTELPVDEQTGDLINTDSEEDSGDVGVSADLIDTSDWETYRNERFGFEIKYPPELIGSEITYEGLSNAGYWRSYIHFNLPKFGQNLYPTYKFEAAGPLVDCERGQSPPGWTNKQTFEIGGVTFTRGEFAYPGDKRINAIRYYGKHQDNCYYLTFSQANELEENVTRFEQIVSTFSLEFRVK